MGKISRAFTAAKNEQGAFLVAEIWAGCILGSRKMGRALHPLKILRGNTNQCRSSEHSEKRGLPGAAPCQIGLESAQVPGPSCDNWTYAYNPNLTSLSIFFLNKNLLSSFSFKKISNLLSLIG